MNPWINIWTKPRQTMAHIIAENPNRSLWTLAAIYGFHSLLGIFQSMMLGAAMSPLGILILAALLSPLWGYVNFSVWSWAVAFTGRWFKGAGSFVEVRSAYAWSSVPILGTIPFWLLLTALFGQQLFLNFSETHLLTSVQMGSLFAMLIAKIIFSVWSIVIYLTAISEVQKFSLLKALLNVLVAAFVLIALFILVWNGIALLVNR